MSARAYRIFTLLEQNNLSENLTRLHTFYHDFLSFSRGFVKLNIPADEKKHPPAGLTFEKKLLLFSYPWEYKSWQVFVRSLLRGR
jgi:hypothetical protein